jgi:AraC-like DNA-binding protein
MKRKSAQRNSIKTLHGLETLGNSPAQAGEIRVERLETRLKPRVPFPHRHDFYHFLFLEKGSGWHEIDFEKFSVKAGQLFLMRPGQVHAWNLSPRTRGFVLEFTRESLGKSEREALLRVADAAPKMILPGSSGQLCRLMQIMLTEFNEKRPAYRAVLEHMLSSILLLLAREAKSAAPPSAGQSFADRFKLLVEENFSRLHKVDDYARLIGISPKALTVKVSQAFGRSAGAVIQDRRLAEAKRLLAYTDSTVAAVGYELGYDDPNYFTRFFRKQTGISPVKFRRLASRTVRG